MKNAVALILTVVLIIAGGLYSLKEFNIEKYPNVDIPFLTVVIPYPGASPEQSMNDIGENLEREFMNLDQVVNVYTDGASNALYSTLEFEMSVDMDEAEQLVRSKVEEITLPDLAEEPQYFLSGPEPDPTVFSFGLYANEQSDEIQAFVEAEIIPRIETIEGINEITVGGVEEKFVYIRLLPEELTNNGITLEDVKTAIVANNLSVPTGDIHVSDEVLPVRVNEQLESIEDVKNTQVLVTRENSETGVPELISIKLSEIAEVSYEGENTGTITRINGDSGVSVGIVAEQGANVVAIVDKIKEEIEGIHLPDGYETEILRDQSIEIEESVDSMLREALLGAVMAMVVTLLFLRNIRSTLIAVISIPLSILASFFVMKAMGYTLNIMTLAGIAVAVGRVVDDSIVVIENVFRRVRVAKEKDEKLVLDATKEVASAITSSTLTTVAVFIPLAFVPGIVGGFFAPLAWTIVISLLFSLVVAITIVPLLSKLFLLKMTPKVHKENALQKGYRKSLNWVLHHRLVTIGMALILLVSSIVLIAPRLGTTFLPQEKMTNFDITVSMENGTPPEKTVETAGKVEDILLDKEEIELVNTNIYGEDKYTSISFVLKDSLENENVNDFVEDLRDEFSTISEAKEITVTSVDGLIGGAENEFALVVNGPNLEDIQDATNLIVENLKNVDGLSDVTTSLEGSEPEIEIVLDEEKLAQHGLMPAIVVQSLRTLMNGDVVTSMRIDDDVKDVIVGLKMDDITSLEELGKQQIQNVMGVPVPLNDIGELQRVENRSVVTHLNGKEYVMVMGQITDSNTGDVTAKVNEVMSNLELPNGVSFYEIGASQAMSEGFLNLTIAIVISIFLVYMVMVLAFGEGRAPFVILFAIPFSIIGALLGLFIVNEPIGMPAMIGLLMLNGIVVTNAIVLIDKVKQNEKSGMSKHEALIEAGVVRIRPILMTAIATIGALLPMAFSDSSGMVSKTLAVVVIGGLTTSTFLTLFIVPVLYSLFNRVKKGNKKKPKKLDSDQVLEA